MRLKRYGESVIHLTDAIAALYIAKILLKLYVVYLHKGLQDE